MNAERSILGTPAELGQIAVERAVAELRAARPVLVTDGDEQSLVVAVEGLEAPLAARLEPLAAGLARLVLPAARLRRLGLERAVAGSLALPLIDLDRLGALAVAVDSRIDAPVRAVSALDELALDLTRLALLIPAAVVIPVRTSREDLGTVARVDAADVASYRACRGTALRIVSRAPVPLVGARETEFVVFRGGEGQRDHVAVIVGAPDPAEPVDIRIHSACLTGDLFGSLKCDCGDQLRETVRAMAAGEGGVILYLDQEGRGNGIANKMRAYRLQCDGFDTYEADEVLGFDLDQRRFDFAGSMLRELGISRVRVVTNNPEKIRALAAAGLTVVADRRATGRTNPHNVRYLAAKRDRAGHLIELDDIGLRLLAGE